MKTDLITTKTTSTALASLREIASLTREKQYVIMERALKEEFKRVNRKASIR